MDWDKYVGLPWKDCGRDESGYDCYGLFCAAFEEGTGVTLPSLSGSYTTYEDRAAVAAALAGGRGPWARATLPPRPFDALLVPLRGLWHVALIVQEGRMLHIRARQTSVIESTARFATLPTELYRHEALL